MRRSRAVRPSSRLSSVSAASSPSSAVPSGAKLLAQTRMIEGTDGETRLLDRERRPHAQAAAGSTVVVAAARS